MILSFLLVSLWCLHPGDLDYHLQVILLCLNIGFISQVCWLLFIFLPPPLNHWSLQCSKMPLCGILLVQPKTNPIVQLFLQSYDLSPVTNLYSFSLKILTRLHQPPLASHFHTPKVCTYKRVCSFNNVIKMWIVEVICPLQWPDAER